MNYYSTRSALSVSDPEAVLLGLAPDGGLFVDPTLGERVFDWEKCLTLGDTDMMTAVLSYLLPEFKNMGKLVERAYRNKFENDCISPLVKCREQYILELYHGPTSAFKDVALSMLPQLLSAARKLLGKDGDTLILTATSGDTGKAALEGFHDVAGTRIVVFYPDGGVSAVQQMQMVTQEGGNVRVCAVRGNFDDCQRGVKEAFAALSEKELSSANSINIGRLAPQVMYYFSAYAQLLQQGAIEHGEKIEFVVPTGNFGDILAGYFAKRMGLPISRLICASNENRILSDFIHTGVYDSRRPFLRTDSPSMDILISSNLERLLYYAAGSEKVKAWMDSLAETGVYILDAPTLAVIQENFAADWATQAECDAACAKAWKEENYLCDPHTAVALAVSEKIPAVGKRVVLSTASPYKFPGAVLRALGGNAEGDEFQKMKTLEALTGVPIPKNLAGLQERPVLHHDVIERSGIISYLSGK